MNKLKVFAILSITTMMACHRGRKGAFVLDQQQIEDAIAGLQQAYAAFNRGNIDAAVRILDPGIEWIEPPEFPGGGTYHGVEGAKKYLTQSRASAAEVISEPEQFIPGKSHRCVRACQSLAEGQQHVAGRAPGRCLYVSQRTGNENASVCKARGCTALDGYDGFCKLGPGNMKKAIFTGRDDFKAMTPKILYFASGNCHNGQRGWKSQSCANLFVLGDWIAIALQPSPPRKIATPFSSNPLGGVQWHTIVLDLMVSNGVQDTCADSCRDAYLPRNCQQAL